MSDASLWGPITPREQHLIDALAVLVTQSAPGPQSGRFGIGFHDGAKAARQLVLSTLGMYDIPKIGPCAGCQYHEINRPDGAACAAGECIEQEA